MNPLKFLQDHPPLGGAILSVLGAALGAYIHNPDMVAALVGMAAVFVGVHQVVTPVTTMATNVAQAATQAATETVKSLDQTVVGTVGEITAPAQAIVQSTVHEVVNGILGKGPS